MEWTQPRPTKCATIAVSKRFPRPEGTLPTRQRPPPPPTHTRHPLAPHTPDVEDSCISLTWLVHTMRSRVSGAGAVGVVRLTVVLDGPRGVHGGGAGPHSPGAPRHSPPSGSAGSGSSPASSVRGLWDASLRAISGDGCVRSRQCPARIVMRLTMPGFTGLLGCDVDFSNVVHGVADLRLSVHAGMLLYCPRVLPHRRCPRLHQAVRKPQ